MYEWGGWIFDEWGLKLWKLGFWNNVLTLVKVDQKAIVDQIQTLATIDLLGPLGEW